MKNSAQNALLDSKKSALLLIDVQEKLIPTIRDNSQLIANCVWLLKVAQRLQVPILASEQYAKGLGPTIAQLRELVPQDALMEKRHFSCVSDPGCLQKIMAVNRSQIVVIGIEAHVCVMQTAMELEAKGKEIYVVADAIASRNDLDKQLAIQRMHAAGISIITKEMVLFEWLHQAGTPEFKEISKEFLR